jgi:hypothetical protein
MSWSSSDAALVPTVNWVSSGDIQHQQLQQHHHDNSPHESNAVAHQKAQILRSQQQQIEDHMKVLEQQHLHEQQQLLQQQYLQQQELHQLHSQIQHQQVLEGLLPVVHGQPTSIHHPNDQSYSIPLEQSYQPVQTDSTNVQLLANTSLVHTTPSQDEDLMDIDDAEFQQTLNQEIQFLRQQPLPEFSDGLYSFIQHNDQQSYQVAVSKIVEMVGSSACIRLAFALKDICNRRMSMTDR